MVKHSNGHAAALRDSAAPGAAGPAHRPVHRRPNPRPMTARPCVDLSESDDTLIVRVPLCEGPIELRVPREAVHAKKRLPRTHRGIQRGRNTLLTPSA